LEGHLALTLEIDRRLDEGSQEYLEKT